MMGVEDFIQRLFRSDHKEVFKEDVVTISVFKAFVSKMPCVACTHETLTLQNFNKGPRGWEAIVECSNCNFKGVFNSTGFDVKSINSKGKARE